MPEQSVTVHSCKFDGRVHRSWRGRIVHRAETLIVLDAIFEQEVRHPLLGTIAPGTLSREYFWTDRWYNVFRFREPSGELRNFYCNVNTPARLEDGMLTFIDLDIDVLVAPDMSFRVLDLDEFEAHSTQFNYPDEIREHAHRALSELVSLIEDRRFPFTAESFTSEG